MDIRALTLHRPWDQLVLRHGKSIENRVWSTSYRGPLLIHAGRSWDEAAIDMVIRLLGKIPFWPTADRHPTGIVGVVDLVDVCSASVNSLWELDCDCGPWAMPGQQHWRLANPRPFAGPIPCRGFQQLWTPPAELHSAVDAALAMATGATRG